MNRNTILAVITKANSVVLILILNYVLYILSLYNKQTKILFNLTKQRYIFAKTLRNQPPAPFRPKGSDVALQHILLS